MAPANTATAVTAARMPSTFRLMVPCSSEGTARSGVLPGPTVVDLPSASTMPRRGRRHRAAGRHPASGRSASLASVT